MDGQEEYVRQVLEAYRKTPGTTGTVRRADRLLAAQLHQRGLSVKVIENALVLAATRRLIRPCRCAASGHDSLAGLFLAGHRGSIGVARQPEVLQISPVQARTHRATPVNAPPARMMENHPARLRRG